MKQTSKKEILKAIKVLEKNNDAVSAAQIRVLENRWSESEVFRKFVVEVLEVERNEDVFFAARDAAMFLTGKLPASAIVPEGCTIDEDTEEADEDDMIQISRREFEDLLKRIERLERRVGLRTSRTDSSYKSMDEAPPDIISATETLKFIGCGKSTLKRWFKAGYITAYGDGRRTYYSRSEIKKSEVYKDYKDNTQWKKLKKNL